MRSHNSDVIDSSRWLVIGYGTTTAWRKVPPRYETHVMAFLCLQRITFLGQLHVMKKQWKMIVKKVKCGGDTFSYILYIITLNIADTFSHDQCAVRRARGDSRNSEPVIASSRVSVTVRRGASIKDSSWFIVSSDILSGWQLPLLRWRMKRPKDQPDISRLNKLSKNSVQTLIFINDVASWEESPHHTHTCLGAVLRTV